MNLYTLMDILIIMQEDVGDSLSGCTSKCQNIKEISETFFIPKKSRTLDDRQSNEVVTVETSSDMDFNSTVSHPKVSKSIYKWRPTFASTFPWIKYDIESHT